MLFRSAGDIRDIESVKKAMDGVQVVLHLAAQIAIPYSYVNPRDFVEVNAVGSLNVAQAALAAGVERFIYVSSIAALYAGADCGTAVLEEGMEWQDGSFNPQESEYLGGRKLTREECARSYHIPLPMVGILDHATFSNISEQHKNLYQDSLGPWLVMIEQDIKLQLLLNSFCFEQMIV